MFPETYDWVKHKGGHISLYAVSAGVTEETEAFIIRRFQEDVIITGYIRRGEKEACIAHGRKEYRYNEYEVLMAPKKLFSWVAASGGDIPDNAFEGGRSLDGEPLFIGRVIIDGLAFVGKVHPSHGVCYFAHDGKEVESVEYDVLTKTDA